jgi:DNA-binding response OmpR family regulator
MSGKVRVLAVDDDRLLRMSIQLFLEEQGFEVDTVSGVAGALDALEQHSYELVLTDLVLGDGSGLEVARQARSSNPGSRVILFTGSEEGLDVDEILDAGASEVLLKPCKLSLLVSKARQVLDRRRADGNGDLAVRLEPSADAGVPPVRGDSATD